MSGRSGGYLGSHGGGSRECLHQSDLVPTGPGERSQRSTLQAELLVSRRELEGLEDKFSRQLRLVKAHGEQAVEVVVKPLEAKVSHLEVQHPQLEWQMTDLDGTVKALSQQVQVQRRHSDALEGALQRLRKQLDEARGKQSEMQEEWHQWASQAQQESGNLQTLKGIVHELSPSLSARGSLSPLPADAATREELIAVAESMRTEIAEVANSCALKPSRQTVVTRQELMSATDLVRQDLRLEMRQFADKVAYGEQTAGEIHRELHGLREDVGSIKAREAVFQNVPRTEANVELLIHNAVDTLRAELKQRHGSAELQGQVDKLEAYTADLIKKVDSLMGGMPDLDRTMRHDTEAVREVADRCEATQTEFRQFAVKVGGAVSSMAQTASELQQNMEEMEQLREEVGELRQEFCSLGPRAEEDGQRSLGALAEIREVHSKVEELRGEVSGYGPRMAASELHFGTLAELPCLRTTIGELREEYAGLAPRLSASEQDVGSLRGEMQQRSHVMEGMISSLADLKSKLVCHCGSVFLPDSAFCRKCGVRRPGHEDSAVEEEICQSPIAGMLDRLTHRTDRFGLAEHVSTLPAEKLQDTMDMTRFMKSAHLERSPGANSEHLGWVPDSETHSETHLEWVPDGPGGAHRPEFMHRPSAGSSSSHPAASRQESHGSVATGSRHESHDLTSSLNEAQHLPGDSRQSSSETEAPTRPIIFSQSMGPEANHLLADSRRSSSAAEPATLLSGAVAHGLLSDSRRSSSTAEPETVGPGGAARGRGVTALSAELFAQVDVNHDGVIDKEELRTALAEGVLELQSLRSADEARSLEKQSSFESLPGDEELDRLPSSWHPGRGSLQGNSLGSRAGPA